MRLPLAALCLALSFAPAAAQTVEDGFEAYDAGDYETAKTILFPLAEAGDARAMNLVGYMYDSGQGFSKSVAIACDWYEKAAHADLPLAQRNFAVCYYLGSGRFRDQKAAVLWFSRAAEGGDVEAQVELVKILHSRFPEKARYWGQKAADAGSVPARAMMDAYELPYSGPRLGIFEKYCFVVMVGFLGKDRNYCD